MIVRYERSGGFAGITLNVEIDSANLTAKQTRELKKLVEQAFPADQLTDDKTTKSETLPDQFNYSYIITAEKNEQSFVATDESLTDEMRALNKWLIATAQKSAR